MSEIQNPSMRPGKPAMLDIAKVKPASENPSDAGFSAVLKEQINVTVPAEGGKSLPEGGQVRLTSRQLLGGTKVKVSGDEPSVKGLEEFARSQGIDPRALGLLKDLETSAKAMSLSVPEELSPPGVTASSEKIAELNGLNIESAGATREASGIGHSSSLVNSAMEAHALLEPRSALGPQLQIHSAPLYEDVTDSLLGTEGTLLNHDAPKEDKNSGPLAHVIVSGSKVGELPEFEGAVPLQMDQTADSSKAKGELLNPRILDHTGSASLLGANRATHQSHPFSGAALGLDALSAKNMQQTVMSEVKITNADLAKAVGAPKVNSDSTVDQLLRGSANHQTNFTGPSSQIVGQNATKEVISKAQSRLQKDYAAGKINLPKADLSALKSQSEKATVVKLPAVNLTSLIPDQGSLNLQSAGPSPVSSFSAVGAGFSFESGTSGQQGNYAAGSENIQDDAPEQLLRRQDQQNQLSQRLSQILGQRLSAQIERGSWRVEMDLHPASMGRIEVQLEMRNGELEANFLSSNAATRDLLNESLPRLREMLEQFGTNSAYVGLGAGNKGQHDGNSAAGADSGSLDAGDGNNTADSTADRKPVSDDGLDVMV